VWYKLYTEYNEGEPNLLWTEAINVESVRAIYNPPDPEIKYENPPNAVFDWSYHAAIFENKDCFCSHHRRVRRALEEEYEGEIIMMKCGVCGYA